MNVGANRSSAAIGQTWLRLGLLGGILITLVGCQASPASTPHPSSSVIAPITIPNGEGLVVGGIDLCAGVYPPKTTGFVAGTVVVLPGTVSYVPESGGGSKTVFPTTRLESQTTAKHEMYRIALPPGPYVLTVEPRGGNVIQWTSIVILAGKVVKQNIPNSCK
ncbi:MAG: hypothetical protein ACYCTZ_06805 [Candidatus Dormibacteria bacterium]